MGLLSFLSRKPSSEPRNNPDVLKAQAYDATVPSMPPIRGTYPVAGNGQIILEQFQKSHPNLASVTHLSETSAPPPLVPRLHSSSTGRPGTASTDHGTSGFGRSATISATAPGRSRLSLRPTLKKRYGSFILPSKLQIGHDEVADSIYSAPSPAFARNRASSLRSINGGETTSTKGFVDLLDAQSSLRPYGFHSRVETTGARNYGEDVANRNMMGTAPPPALSKTDELYAKSFGMDLTAAADDDSEDGQPRLSRKSRSMGSNLRASSAKSTSHGSFPRRKKSRGSLQPLHSGKAEKDNRRQSLPSYMISSDQLEGASRRGGVEETDPDYFPDSLRMKARAAATHEDYSSRSLAKSDSPRKQVSSSKKARDSTLPTKPATPRPHSHHNRSESEQTLPDRETRPKSAKYSARRRSLSHTSSISVSKSPSKSVNRQDFLRSNSKENMDSNQRTIEPQTPPRSREHDLSKRRLGSTSHIHDSPLQLIQPSQMNSSPNRPSTGNRSGHHIRNRSIVSLSTKSINAFDIENSIPERTSSIRRWSLTSETGGSTHSSNPFRPQSGHTTNTSIENGPIFPFSPSITSISANNSRTDCAVLAPSLKATRTHSSIRSSAKSTRQQTQNEFNIDDYVSSDDSNTSPRRARGEEEKDLLFANTGYGAEGFQLPGLPGMFDAAAPQATRAHPPKTKRTKGPQTPFHMTAFTPDAADTRSIGKASRSSRSTPYESHSRTLRLRIPAFSYSDSEEDDADNHRREDHRIDDHRRDDSSSEDEISFDIPRTRPTARRYSHGSTNSRPPRYEAAEEPIFEGQVLDFLDALQSSFKEDMVTQPAGNNDHGHNTSPMRRTRRQRSRIGSDA
ncbi:hypothetical protein F5X99DRAFT_220285 [Biscogniauxia marginata]|nr:hypothetical protein F5X99DRAFT_220285 [Biscogniauxia marginata]